MFTQPLQLARPPQPFLHVIGLSVGLAAAVTIGALELVPMLVVASGVAVAVLAVRWPVVVLGLVLLSVPFASLAQIDAGDFAITAREGLVFFLVAGWLVNAAVRRELRLHGGWLLVALLWVLGAMLLSLTFAASLPLAAKETVKWLELIAVFLFVAAHVRTRTAMQGLLCVLLVAGVAEAAYGLYQVAAGAAPASFAVGSVVRAYGTFDQPNPFAGYLGTLLPLAVVFAATLRSRKAQVLAAAGLTVVLLAFLASQSRGAWIGLGLACLAALVVWGPGSRRLLAPLAYGVMLVVLVGLLGLLPAQLTDRLSIAGDYAGLFDVRDVQATPENWAVVERMAHWQAGWYMFQDHPLLGVGPGNYSMAYERYFLPGWSDPLGHAHNYYLNTAAELGVPGLLGVVAVVVLAFVYLAGALRRLPPGSYWRLIALGLLVSLTVFAFHNVFDNLLVHGMSLQIGFLLGLVVVVARQAHGQVQAVT